MTIPVIIELPDGTSKRLEFDDSMPTDQIKAETEKLYNQLTASPIQKGMNLGLEAIAGFNRPFASLIDMGLPGTPMQDRIGQPGEFAGPGLATDMAANAGELAGFALPIGASSRFAGGVFANIAKALPEGRVGSASAQLENVFKTLGSTSTFDELAYASTFGAGSPAVGEYVAQRFGEEYRGAAEAGFEIGGPIALSTLRTAMRVAKDTVDNLFINGAPDSQTLRGAADYQYALLDAAGIQANGPSRTVLKNTVEEFKDVNNISSIGNVDTLDGRVTRILRAVEGDDPVTYSMLVGEARWLRDKFRNDTTPQGVLGLELANMLDDFMYTMKTEGGEQVGRTIKQTHEAAKKAYQAAKTYDAFEWAVDDAKLTASGLTPNDYWSALDGNIKKLLRGEDAMGQGRFLTDYQRKLLRGIIDGTSTWESRMRGLSQIGYQSKDFVRNVLLASAAATVTGAAGSFTGAEAVTAAGGTTSAALLGFIGVTALARRQARNMFQNNIRLGQATVAAGDNATDVVKAYMQSVPAESRNSQDLAVILAAQGVNLGILRESPLVRRSKWMSDSVFLAGLINSEARLEEYNSQEDVPAVPAGY